MVTAGAGAGIGGAIVERLHLAGAQLVVTDLSSNRINALRDRLDGDGASAMCEAMDASDEQAVAELFDRVRDRFGRLDVLVNSAGVNRLATIPDLDLESWRQILEISLTSHYLHIHRAWPMLAERGGSVINIASIAAWSPTSLGEAHYAAAKAGVLGLTRAAAAEGAAVGIRVNAVAPGLITNQHLEKSVPRPYIEAYKNRSISTVAGQPRDVAETVHFLATDASAHITGETITVAGGHLARH
jgi:NAD(P)-dependent dehydrogenase (short-subunit alcohol dehydrogenase family)